MWLTLLWQNKGLIGVGLCVLLVAGLLLTVKVQMASLDSAKIANKTLETERDVAIKAHDELVDDWKRQQGILAEREALRKQQEEQNARLHQTIKAALQNHRVWAVTPIPDSLRQTLSTLPNSGHPSQPVKPDSGASVRRVNQ